MAGYYLVKRLEEPAETASGIVLADTARKDKSREGEIIAVGASKDGKGAQVSVGQTVIFKQYGPIEVEVDGEELLLIEEEDILAAYFG